MLLVYTLIRARDENLLTDEAITGGGNKLRTILAISDDGFVEIFNGLAKPHADDEEAGQACNRDMRL